MPRIRELGLTLPDPELRLDEATGRWLYTEPDWQELRTVVTNHGPKSEERLEFRRLNYDRTQWVRDTILSAPRRRRSPDMTDQLPADRGPAAEAAPPLEAWEVFRQEKEGDPMRHGGSVMAPDAVLAVHYAREMYSRRQESVRLWVVRRADVHDLADPDLLQPPLDRSFKKPGGYVMRDKLAAAREQSGNQAEAEGRAVEVTTIRRATTRPDRGVRRPGDAGRARRAAAVDGRRRVRHRLLRLRVDRHRAAARGGRGDQLARPGRARPRAALYTLLAEVRADGRDADAIAYDRQPDEYRHARLLDHGRGDWAMTIARRYLYDTADGARLDGLVGSSFAPLRELVDKIRREERYHVMHATAWLERLAAREGEPRERLLAALEELAPDAATVFSPLAGEAAPRRGRRPGRADGGPRGPLAGDDHAAVRRTSACRCRRPRPIRTEDGPTIGEPFRWLWTRVHVGPPFGPGGDMVTAVAAQPARFAPRP